MRLSALHQIRQAIISLFLTLSLALAPLATALPALAAPPEHSAPDSEPSYVPGQLIVQYKSGTGRTKRRSIERRAGISGTIEKLGAERNRDIIHLVELEPGQSIAESVRELRADPNILIAEPNYRRSSSFMPDDPDLNEQWGLHNTGQIIDSTSTGIPDADMDMPEAWDYEQGQSNEIVVAVIDSGIDLEHPDLKNKLWQNTGEIPGNNLDDDGNGYIDDVNGYNFAGIAQKTLNFAHAVGALDYEMAQSIKGTGAFLTHVGLPLLRRGMPPGDLVVAVREDLDGPDLSTAVISPADVMPEPYNIIIGNHLINPPFGDNYTQLSTPIKLTKDQTYYLVLSSTAPNPEEYYIVGALSPGLHYINGKYYPDYDYYQDGIEHWKVGDKWADITKFDLGFYTNPNPVPRDDNGHGTHVGGIIGAETDNGVGGAGVSPGALIMPVKAGGSDGTLWSSDVIQAIYYAADNGAKVINMSFGGKDFSVAEQLAVYYALGKGATMVAAVGNAGTNTEILYPAAYDAVIGVGATTNQDNRAIFSNWNSFVDLTAPGERIYSTMPTYSVGMNAIPLTLDQDGPFYEKNYEHVSGTSMAAPMAAGVAALILSRQPGAVHYAVQKVLQEGADDLGDFGHDNHFGFGRVNARQSLLAMLLKTDTLSSPAAPQGDNGWFTVMPTISFTTDIESPTTYYRWDDDPSDTTYAVPFQPPSEGEHRLYFYSVDGNNATETVRNRIFRVDTGLPEDPDTITSPSHDTGVISTDPTVDIAFSGATDTVSGVGGYAVSWTKNATETPSPTVNLAAGADSATSPVLSSDSWWFNLRTKDVAGNWTSTKHLGPFLIDGPAVTGQTITPSGPDGENSWYKTNPKLKLVPSEPAAVYYQIDSQSPGSWIGDATPDPFVDVTVPDGERRVYYYSVDGPGNQETVKDSGVIKVDTVKPTAGIALNAGNKTPPRVLLNLTGNDPGGSGVAKMRFKPAGGSWGNWETFSAGKLHDFGPDGGTKTIYFQTKDSAGNISDVVSASLLQSTPVSKMTAPFLSTKISKSRLFKLSWSASDPYGVGIANYDIQYKVAGGDWTDWKAQTTATSARFDKGKMGKTYYFQARARDNAGNSGVWSAAKRTIIPRDNDALIYKRSGFSSVYSNRASKFYNGTLRTSARAGHTVTYKFTGKQVLLINTKAANRSKAKIYIDGKYVKTIDNYSPSTKYRQVTFRKSWAKSGTHNLKIENLGTPGRRLYDVDAIGVLQ